MTRATSREAYQALVDSGQLRGRQAEALWAVINNGPATSAEIISSAGLGANVNLWRARFTELVARGLIREVSARKCKITGRRALVWEATGRTKPLDAVEGHAVSGKAALRAVAAEAIAALEGHGTVGAAEAKSLRKRLDAIR